jgi:phosphoglycerol transferase MdoB-like AlkP superfamily enzyme
MNAPSLLSRWGQGAVRGLALGWAAGLWLTACLGVIRLIQLWHYWPANDAGLADELHLALWMGLRFDLKVCASAALLLWPLLCWRRAARATLAVWTVIYVLLALVNFYYYGFYKTPIDSVVFGVVDDDTQAIFKTIWLDFPIAQIAIFLLLSMAVAIAGVWQLDARVARLFDQRSVGAHALWVLPVAVFVTLLTVKGTLKGIALQPANMTITTQPFLNDAVPNGVTALHNAWFAYSESTHVDDVTAGLKSRGFASAQEAAQALGWSASDDDAIAAQLLVQGASQPNGKHLVFFQMESWSAEPLRYQSPQFDVMARLQGPLQSAAHFDNFDSAHVGTHPSLEAILLGTPLTPISTGRYREVVYPWGLAQVLKRAGYDTLFVTSGESGWRELDRVLLRQGFDEFVDAAALRLRYPDAGGGVWGVWDSYMMRYIQERLKAQPANKPLFIYGMTTTHHPPYEVPSEAMQVTFDMRQWQGDASSESLVPSLYSYRYANDVLGAFVHDVQTGPLSSHTLIAATGDHIMRTVGLYVEPERRAMRQQVPFVVWGAPPLTCAGRLHEPASHLDMFPTLLPLLGVNAGYLRTGRNLWDCQARDAIAAPMALTFVDQVRTPQAIWQPGQRDTLACQPPKSRCDWPELQDRQARARVALLDWNVRRRVLQATAKVTP